MKKLNLSLGVLATAACLLTSVPALAGGHHHYWGGGGYDGWSWDGDSDSDSWKRDGDSDSWKGDHPAGAVPEPTAALVFGAGAVAMGWALRRRRE